MKTVDPDATYTYTLYRDGKAVERSSSNVFTVTTDGAYAVGVTASKTSGTDTLYSREVERRSVPLCRRATIHRQIQLRSLRERRR